MRKATYLLTGITLLILAILALTYRPAAAQTFPEIIPLPDGFQPEGIVSGRGTTLYAGSLADGSIYEVNLRTGEGELLVQGGPGQTAVGLSFERIDTITHDAFDIPTTIAGFGNALYVVNARFLTTPGPDTEYNIVRVESH